MQVHTDPISLQLIRPAASIGIFDGVHRGHQNLLARVKDLALRSHSQTLVVTFWPHPRIVLGKAGPDFKLLTSLEEKTEMLSGLGIDHLLIVPFTVEFAGQSANQFLDDFLNRYIKPGVIVVGDDLRFGSGGSGNLDLLVSSGKVNGFEVIRLETHTDNEARISSTLIRTCLLSGDLQSANNLLGYPYFITGKVVRGNRIGNTIGFPTANIECLESFKQIPSDGVYAVIVDRKGNWYKGMLNIGIRPTIEDNSHKTIEVHLFDVSDDLYMETLKVRFISRLRDEMKFDGLGQLKAQLALDRQASIKVLEKY
ncbi:MAG: bifunctional riboflavin kinase/FAD synthetase [Porphyromonadaceae bacterium]|nr:MAG: bifunctional riboflavin kinase/FAD synthetase [Porphyromonadaceae bacterium]